MRTILQRLGLLAGILALWQGLCLLNLWSRYLLPEPAQVALALREMLRSGELAHHVLASLGRVLLGYGLAAAMGVCLGICTALLPRLSHFFAPLARFLRAVPPLGLTPLLILWLGIGEGAKIAVIFLSAFFPVLSATTAGVLGCDQQLREVGKAFGLSPAAVLRHIVLPSALPSIGAGLCLGLGYAWRAIIGAEMIAAASGLGYLVLDAQAMARTDKIIAGILVIGLLGLLLDWLLCRIQRHFRLSIPPQASGKTAEGKP